MLITNTNLFSLICCCNIVDYYQDAGISAKTGNYRPEFERLKAEIDTAFDYIPDESNDSVIYMKEPVPISVGVKPVKFCEDNTEEKN